MPVFRRGTIVAQIIIATNKTTMLKEDHNPFILEF